MMRRVLSLGVALTAACGSAGSAPSPVARRPPEVRVWGTLRGIMHEGKTDPAVVLSEVVPGPHTYALGALSQLRGEVLVLDDRLILSRAGTDRRVHIVEEGDRSEQAALLVSAKVATWVRVPVREAIGADALDARIEALAAAAGIDTGRPFPFLVDGRFTSVDWHVLGGLGPSSAASHDAHAAAAARGTLTETDGRALGFYSTTHTGVFTHMGSRTHVHVLAPAAGIMGHVDRMGIAAGSTLLFPVADGS